MSEFYQISEFLEMPCTLDARLRLIVNAEIRAQKVRQIVLLPVEKQGLYLSHYQELYLNLKNLVVDALAFVELMQTTIFRGISSLEIRHLPLVQQRRIIVQRLLSKQNVMQPVP